MDASLFLVDRKVDMSEWDRLSREAIVNEEEFYRPIPYVPSTPDVICEKFEVLSDKSDPESDSGSDQEVSYVSEEMIPSPPLSPLSSDERVSDQMMDTHLNNELKNERTHRNVEGNDERNVEGNNLTNSPNDNMRFSNYHGTNGKNLKLQNQAFPTGNMRKQYTMSDASIWDILTDQALPPHEKHARLRHVAEDQLLTVCRAQQVDLEGWTNQEHTLVYFLCPYPRGLTLKQYAIRSCLMSPSKIQQLRAELLVNPYESQIFGTQYLDIMVELLFPNYHHILGISLQPHHQQIIAFIRAVREEAQLIAQYLELSSKRAKLTDIDRLLDHSNDLLWYASGYTVDVV